jgi:DNA repair protein RadD
MLRDYQAELKAGIIDGWSRVRFEGIDRPNVLAVMATGAGKTVVMSDIAHEEPGATAEIAHRQELVLQISTALARTGTYHRIVAPPAVQRFISQYHTEEVGSSFVHQGAPHAVLSVDTLIRREEELDRWRKQVTLWQTDEGHHLLLTNKWGRGVQLFPRARGIGWTAYPGRSDRKSLKHGHGGVFHHMVLGPDAQYLIDRKFLVPAIIYGPTPSIDVSNIPVTPSGDYSPVQLRDETQKSTIVGDTVQSWFKWAGPFVDGAGSTGKRTVCFCVDVQHANQTVNAFRAAGVSTAIITDKTPDADRVNIMRRFRRGDITMLVNVDILGEGVDVPAIECVIMARPTESFQIYTQQFGRLLRILLGKTHGILIDQVGNVIRHNGPPTRHRILSLDPPERRRKRVLGDVNTLVPMTACGGCSRTYERTFPACPYCGTVPVPGTRPSIEQVDGDLTQYDEAFLRLLTAEADRLVGAVKVPFSKGSGISSAVLAQHNLTAAAQRDLRSSMDWWAGAVVPDLPYQRQLRTFYHRFGIDVATAKTLKQADAEKLQAAIWSDVNAAR